MKKTIFIKIIPFLIMPVLLILFFMFIFSSFIDYFGCGCSPYPNANDIKKIFWICAAILDIILLIIISKTIAKRRFVYITFGSLWIIFCAFINNMFIYAK